jgi:hypothetical protein
MPATIVSMENTDPLDDVRAVERQFSKAFYDYWRSGDGHSFSDPDIVYAKFLEGRIRALETSIRRLLTSGVLTESQRTGLLITAYGSKTGTLKDADLLTEAETRLIERYRSFDSAGRAAMRTLLDSRRSNGGAS